MGSIVLNVALALAVEAIVAGVIILIKYPNVIHKKTLIVIAISFAVIAMCVNPTEYWDVYRQYQSLDAIRDSGIGLTDFLFNNRLRIGGSDYTSLFFYNVIRYIVVATNNNRLLPFIMTCITYGIWCYITIDWQKKHWMPGNYTLFSMMLCGILMPFIFVNSGLRNTTAAAIMALAIYNNLVKKHSIIELAILFSVALTIHFSVAYVMVVFLLSKLRSVKLAIGILFLGTNCIPQVAGLLQNSKYEILRKMSSSFLLYAGNRKYGLNYYLIGAGVILLAMLISFLVGNGTDGEKRESTCIRKFMIVMVASSILNIGYSEMVLRPLYVLGTLSTPVLYSLCSVEESASLRQSTRLNQNAIVFMCILIGLMFVLRVSLPEYMVITYC